MGDIDLGMAADRVARTGCAREPACGARSPVTVAHSLTLECGHSGARITSRQQVPSRSRTEPMHRGSTAKAPQRPHGRMGLGRALLSSSATICSRCADAVRSSHDCSPTRSPRTASHPIPHTITRMRWRTLCRSGTHRIIHVRQYGRCVFVRTSCAHECACVRAWAMRASEGQGCVWGWGRDM